MFRLVVILTVAATAMAGYADSSSGSNQVGNGYGYGYSGGFSGGSGGGGAGLPFPPTPQFNFNNFLQQYFDSLRRYHEQFAAHYISYAAATSDPQSNARAKSSLTVDNASGVHQHGNPYPNYGFPSGGFPAHAGFPNIPGQAGFGGFGGSFGNFGGGQEGAAASASIGPGGVHQTAGVFPENPSIPNVDNRFGSTPQEGAGGFYSVSTSSQSASSNVDGKPTSFHQATTTVNDNGKVTTYTVKKP